MTTLKDPQPVSAVNTGIKEVLESGRVTSSGEGSLEEVRAGMTV